MNAVFQALRLRQTMEDLPRYFFTNNFYLPARRPARDLANAFGGGDDLVREGPIAAMLGGSLTLGHSVTVMLAYALLFGALLTWLFVRRDVD